MRKYYNEIGFAEFVANVEWNQDYERLWTGSLLSIFHCIHRIFSSYRRGPPDQRETNKTDDSINVEK